MKISSLACAPPEPECELKGLCVGNLVQFEEKCDSYEQCLNLCKESQGCRWFTFASLESSNKSECILLNDCNTLDETCEKCLSGERRCENKGKTFTCLKRTCKIITSIIRIKYSG